MNWAPCEPSSKEDRQIGRCGRYGKAVSIQPNFAPGWRELGMLQAQQQNYPEAAKTLSRAVELGLGDAKLFNFLGIAYSRTDRQQQAIAAYRKPIQTRSAAGGSAPESGLCL